MESIYFWHANFLCPCALYMAFRICLVFLPPPPQKKKSTGFCFLFVCVASALHELISYQDSSRSFANELHYLFYTKYGDLACTVVKF